MPKTPRRPLLSTVLLAGDCCPQSCPKISTRRLAPGLCPRLMRCKQNVVSRGTLLAHLVCWSRCWRATPFVSLSRLALPSGMRKSTSASLSFDD